LLKYSILLGEGWYMDLTDILRAVKDGKMDIDSYKKMIEYAYQLSREMYNR
jgi:hypothetical protein